MDSCQPIRFVRRLAIAEVILAVVAFQTCTWILAPRVTDPGMAWLFLIVLGLLCLYPVTVSAHIWRFMGAYAWVRMPWPGRTRYLHDLRLYVALTLAAAIAALLISLVTNPGWENIDAKRLAQGLVRYLGLAAVQVFFYFVFILPRLALALQSKHPGDNRTILALAAIFCLCHLPNPTLMLLGPLIASVWAWAYRHRPNPILLCASHAVLGTLLAEVAQLQMRIGVAYNTPGFRPFRTALASVLNSGAPLF
jgi:hypothetical protein